MLRLFIPKIALISTLSLAFVSVSEAQTSSDKLGAPAGSSTELISEENLESHHKWGAQFFSQAVSNMKSRNDEGSQATTQSLNYVSLLYTVTETGKIVMGGQFEYNSVIKPSHRLKDDSEMPETTSTAKDGYVPRDPFFGYQTSFSGWAGSDDISLLLRYFVPATAASLNEKQIGILWFTMEFPWLINRSFTWSLFLDPRLKAVANNEATLSMRTYTSLYWNVSKSLQFCHTLGFINNLGQESVTASETSTEGHSILSGYKSSESFENETSVIWTLNNHFNLSVSISNSAPVQGYDASGVASSGFRWYHAEETDYNLYTTITY